MRSNCSCELWEWCLVYLARGGVTASTGLDWHGADGKGGHFLQAKAFTGSWGGAEGSWLIGTGLSMHEA